MMKNINDLPQDLVGEILTWVPITSLRSVRSTCKLWKALSQRRIVGKAIAAKQQQFLGFMTLISKVSYITFGTRQENNDWVDLHIKPIDLFNHVEVSNVFHCDGLMLFVARDHSRLVLWNPYLGQTRWIELMSRNVYRFSHYVVGYDHNKTNHKILRLSSDDDGKVVVEIYHIGSSSWKVLDLIDPGCKVYEYYRGVTVKGNSYFFGRESTTMRQADGNLLVSVFILCFDFTRESFGQRLRLPFDHMYVEETVILSGVKEEQLAVLYEKSDGMLEFWVSDKIDPNAMSWSKVLVMDRRRPYSGIYINQLSGSFFIDVEKKFAVVFDEDPFHACGCPEIHVMRSQTAYIIEKDGHCVSVILEDNPHLYMANGPPFIVPKFCAPEVSSSYLPSLVQIN